MTQRLSALSREGRFFHRDDERNRLLGVTYGPFERPLEGGDETRRDLDQIRKVGFNSLRIYERPAPSFLSACAARGLNVFISLKWGASRDFRQEAGEVSEALVKTVRTLREAPAVAGYFVGNEIPSDLVRWMGWPWVRDFLEKVTDRLKGEDRERLFAYANYPSTESVQPRNGDFAAFNLYLEEPEAMDAYLRRLHHVAGDLPLVVSEYGMDSLRHGEDGQAEALRWMAETIFRAGAMGAFLFSYTDEWFNGRRSMTDWRFGLVRSDRSPKPSWERVAEALRGLEVPGNNQGIPYSEAPRGGRWPKVSVIVCTHNGHASLPQCLQGLLACRYLDFETLVVDDGSRPGIDVLVSDFEGMRYLRQEHEGLSAARNHGARLAKGEILVFTDDDCAPDREWLVRLVLEMLERDLDACGGPNIDTEAEGLVARCIQWAPGHPAQVMLDDWRAEHLPGCNLAVKREAFDEIGGFEVAYRVAGDDVDFCWRLRMAGNTLGFSPNAVVWHRRRRTWRAFVRQQYGYGRAEARLEQDHPEKMGGLGGLRWAGTVYTSPVRGPSVSSAVIYQGAAGGAPYQLVYPRGAGGGGGVAGVARFFFTSAAWMAILMGALLMGLGVRWAWGVAGLMLLLSWWASAREIQGVWVGSSAGGWRRRLLLATIHWSASVCRQWVRWLNGRDLDGRWPLVVDESLAFWNAEGEGRERLLEALEREWSVGEGAPGKPFRRSVNPWAVRDGELPASDGLVWVLVTATEIHEGGGRLTRLRVRAHLRRGTGLLFALGFAWVLGQALGGHFWMTGAGLLVWALVGAGFYAWTRRRLAGWIERLREVARRAGITEIPSDPR